MPGINKKQFQQLEKAYAKKRLAQAYLFSGPKGVGKVDALFDFLDLVNDGIDREKIMQGSDPDFVIVRPEIEKQGKKQREKNISIGQIKEAVGRIGFFPYKAKFKFLIILEADKMNIAAANSLLKLIEEPSDDTMIILVSNNEQRVLPTIKSRCQLKRFGFVPEDALRSVLAKEHSKANQNDLELAVEFSKGRIKMAEEYLLDDPEMIKLNDLVKQFRDALRGGVVSGFKLSEELSNDKKQLIVAMNEWILYLRDFLRKRVEADDDRRVIRKIFTILDSLVFLSNQIESTNANQRLQLDNFFARIN